MRALILTLFIVVVQLGFAQNPTETLKEIYHQLTTKLEQHKDEFYVRYKVENTFYDQQPSLSQTVEIATHNGITAFQTEIIHVYEDGENKVSVLPGEKVIHVVKKKQHASNANYHNQLFDSFNHLLNDLQFVYSKNIVKNDLQLQQLTFKLSHELAKKYEVEDIVYIVDTANKRFESIAFNYSEQYEYRSTTLTFYEFTAYKNQIPIESNALNHVFDAKGDRKQKFNDYQLIGETHP